MNDSGSEAVTQDPRRNAALYRFHQRAVLTSAFLRELRENT
jgi:hypothetical protein